jgi:hypothetical protein
MANTTNYNWETPDDTDLVKDGAAAIRTLGSSVDTTTKALNPSTTLGDIEYRSSTANTNTRLGIGTTGQILSVVAGVPAWVANDVGDITEVAAGTGISVASGTGPIPTVSIDTAITADLTTAQTLTNKTLTSPVLTTPTLSTIDAKADLIVGTADNTIGRLAVGTDGHVLTADSTVSPTGLKWAAPASGGLTLINSTSFNNTVNNYTVSSIPTTYKNLIIIGSGLQTSAGSTGPIQLQFNGDAAANYNNLGIRNNAGTIQSDASLADTSIQTGIVFGLTGDSSGRFGGFQMFINNYASTSLYRTTNNNGFAGPGGSFYVNQYAANYNNNTTAITSIKFINASGGDFKAGTIQIYGVN